MKTLQDYVDEEEARRESTLTDAVRRATINIEAEKANPENVEVAVKTLPTNPTLSESLYKQMKEAEAVYIDRIAEDTRARDKLNEHIKDGEYALRSVRNAIESLEQTAFANAVDVPDEE